MFLTGRTSFSASPTRVVSTIGAGDGFAAGFLYVLNRRLPLEDCLHYGNAAAAVVVSRVNCAAPMPNREEQDQFLRATGPKGLKSRA